MVVKQTSHGRQKNIEMFRRQVDALISQDSSYARSRRVLGPLASATSRAVIFGETSYVAMAGIERICLSLISKLPST